MGESEGYSRVERTERLIDLTLGITLYTTPVIYLYLERLARWEWRSQLLSEPVEVRDAAQPGAVPGRQVAE